ncbi:hypothetical protein BJ085DRAFT_32181 [Dimargaris cristalligena]|uniref:Uncharacterized protein n=1 Tax=Dimargaris cristalligena TaxID=215637 RepID=A0A4V1J414_9FUNG|nr:hypothetical protein BJ085DRAFT_32181 [Dimargaris cristalligena]|eukprot:RKP33969.1 hypothetical protein BJ085DRAFT_32181 [Dimargaris cristalligena]
MKSVNVFLVPFMVASFLATAQAGQGASTLSDISDGLPVTLPSNGLYKGLYIHHLPNRSSASISSFTSSLNSENGTDKSKLSAASITDIHALGEADGTQYGKGLRESFAKYNPNPGPPSKDDQFGKESLYRESESVNRPSNVSFTDTQSFTEDNCSQDNEVYERLAKYRIDACPPSNDDQSQKGSDTDDEPIAPLQPLSRQQQARTYPNKLHQPGSFRYRPNVLRLGEGYAHLDLSNSRLHMPQQYNHELIAASDENVATTQEMLQEKNGASKSTPSSTKIPNYARATASSNGKIRERHIITSEIVRQVY